MRSGFFNSNIEGYDDYGNPIYDRAEEASFFAEYFGSFIGNGVYANPSNGMQVVANGSMEVLVQPGKCFISGYYGKVEQGGEIVRFDRSDTNYARIDCVVARLNIEDRKIKLAIVKGTPATKPVAPGITRNSNIYELVLANVVVNKNVSVITQANITDTRLDKKVCGVVTGVIEQLDTSTLFEQYKTWFDERKQQADEDYQVWFEGFTPKSEAEFKAWFERIKGQLSSDVAGNLQIEIDELEERISTNTSGIADLEKNKINKATQVVNSNLNDLTDTGFYYCASNSTNRPTEANGYLFMQKYTDNYSYQRYIPFKGGSCYERVKSNGSWEKWEELLYKTGGTLTGSLTTKEILPDSNQVRDIGTQSKRYRNGYFYRHCLYGGLDFFVASNVAIMSTPTTGATIRDNSNIDTYRPISASAFNISSSRRYKENIVDMGEEEANLLDNIKVVKFDYKNRNNGTNVAGVIAEDVLEILPGVVTTTQIEGNIVADSVDYSKFVPYLIKKVQLLEKKISKKENKEEI